MTDAPQLGTLYGVGVGPGAPDLLTVRAVEVLRKTPVIVCPQPNKHTKSRAWKAIKSHVRDVEGQEVLHLEFPMTRDPEILRPAWDAALAAMATHLEAGRDVAFVTIGDPMVYSTYTYLHRIAAQRWPELQRVVVSGLSSLNALAGIVGWPLVDGQQRLALVPASYETERLGEFIDSFDTVVMMKAGSVIRQIIAALDERELLDDAIYISNGTMPEERVVRDLRELADLERCDYFSMVIVTKPEHAGLLAGEATSRSASHD